MSEWIDIKDREPEEGQEVIYFFDVCGVFRGKFARDYMDDPEVWGEEIAAEAREKGWYMQTFYGERGFLGDDVTHWMPDDGRLELPKGPDELIVQGVTLNGWPVRKT